YGGARENRAIDRVSYYQWEKTWQIVRDLQPGAAIFSDVGPDLRWVGNELGIAHPDSFGSITPEPPPEAPADHKAAPGYSNQFQLPGGSPEGAFYLPPECDVPLRPGWFYHPHEDGLQRTLPELLQIYLSSVGAGGFWNLGIAPMPSGELNPGDVQRLQEWGKTFRSLFEHCRFQQTIAIRRGEWNSIPLEDAGQYNLLQFSEDLSCGERIRSYTFRFRRNGETVAEITGKAVGRNRLRLLPIICADTLEYLVDGTGADDFLLTLAAYLAPEELFQAEIKQKSILDRPDYRQVPAEKICRDSMQLTAYLPEETLISGFVFVPYCNLQHGLPDHYSLEYRDSSGAWHLLRSGEFSNIAANPLPQIILFDPICCREIRFRAEHLVAGHSFLFRECGIFSAKSE
ncbi:MAG: hypothetical protein J6R85_00025, partial [Lentisphaeria bacterium]|nr:hypothetical protein [Lentisphaeria bacterium]